jgi:hypothetical protein
VVDARRLLDNAVRHRRRTKGNVPVGGVTGNLRNDLPRSPEGFALIGDRLGSAGKPPETICPPGPITICCITVCCAFRARRTCRRPSLTLNSMFRAFELSSGQFPGTQDP